ncbi:MAG: hypothetical protein ACRCYS_11445 [Beijerinckiaceae bacterium]
MDGTTNGQADLSRRVVALAISDSWSNADALQLVGEADLPSIIASYERGMISLADDEGLDGKGKLSMAVEDGLALIATKLNPTMSTEQADGWTKTLRAALSDLPGRIVRDATTMALRKPIRFFPEVDGVIRECADELMVKHRNALFRLKRLLKEIEDAKKPKLAAPEGYEDGKAPPMTLDQIRETARGHMGKTLMGIGLACGAISQEDHDTVMKELENEPATE